ncbi:MAG: hypothetical protein AB7F89_16590, partial [Pirellulaceae bacterium]
RCNRCLENLRRSLTRSRRRISHALRNPPFFAIVLLSRADAALGLPALVRDYLAGCFALFFDVRQLPGGGFRTMSLLAGEAAIGDVLL